MDQPVETNVGWQRTQTICLVTLTTIAVGFTLFYLQTVLLPFVIALFLVIGCRPILDVLEKRLRLHWFLAFLVTFALGVLLLAALAFITWFSVTDLTRNAPSYQRRVEQIIDVLADRFPSWFPDDTAADPGSTGSSDSGVMTNDAGQPPLPTTVLSADDPADQLSARSREAIDNFLKSLGGYAEQFLISLAGSLTSLLSYAVLILIFVFFLLLGRAGGTTKPPPIVVAVDEQIRRYLVMKTVISALTGLATGLVLWLFGVPLAIVFGFLAFLLNYIPNIGPLITNLLPVPFLILNDQMSPWAAIICFLLISAIQFVSGNVIETRVMGRSFDVSPVVLLLSLMFFGLIWGIIGMFLATPIVSIIKIVLQQKKETKPISELMAGRWELPETQG